MITVAYVTRNRAEALGRSLSALCDLPGPEREVLVFDNGSSDDTGQVVERAPFPVELVTSPTNLGVAAGRNAAFGKASGEVILALDDDARLETGHALAELEGLFDASPRLAVVALRIVDAATGRTLSHELPKRFHNRAAVEAAGAVGYFVGCGFAVRRRAFFDVGGFWEELPYGLEELDLSYRLLDAGWDLRYRPDLVVVHEGTPVGERGPAWHYHLARSRILVAARNLPIWAAAPHLAFWHVAMLGLGVVHGRTGSVLAGLRDGWRDLPKALAVRRPIRAATARDVLRRSGRLFS